MARRVAKAVYYHFFYAFWCFCYCGNRFKIRWR